jgi:hypothetical protein
MKQWLSSRVFSSNGAARFQKEENAIGRMSETDDGQKARNACNIGTQPVRPTVYGVNAPL